MTFKNMYFYTTIKDPLGHHSSLEGNVYCLTSSTQQWQCYIKTQQCQHDFCVKKDTETKFPTWFKARRLPFITLHSTIIHSQSIPLYCGLYPHKVFYDPKPDNPGKEQIISPTNHAFTGILYIAVSPTN